MSRASEMQGFLPDDYLELRMQRRTNILWALVFLVVAGSIGWAYMIAQKKIQLAETQNQRVNEEYAAQAKSIETFKSLQEEQAKLNAKAELVGSLGERVSRSNVLAELTLRLPTGVYLTDFALEGKPRTEGGKAVIVPVGQPKPILYDVNMTISGLAYSDTQAMRYLENLRKCPLFMNVEFEYVEETVYKEVKLRQFKLTAQIDPTADTRASSTGKPATQPAAE